MMFLDFTELCRQLDLPTDLIENGREANKQYSLRVTQSYLNRIEKGNPNDPLLRQILPTKQELDAVPGFSDDPCDEQACRSVLMQKYAARTLILTTDCCPVHCRFCFRRHFFEKKLCSTQQNAEIFPILRQNSSIREVILSGGDPLSLADEQLSDILAKIRAVSHVKRIRVHSRTPIVSPERITKKIVGIMEESFPVYLVLHVNHPNELNDEVFDALRHFRQVRLLSQTVLLKGVNDQIDVLHRLFETLADHGIMPYYLHQLDKVSGAAHFEVSEEDGKRLVEELRQRLPGYAVPRYVREIAGGPYKQELK